MLTRGAFAVAVSAALAGCMTATAHTADSGLPDTPADSCQAAAAQSYIGKLASAEVGAELLRLTGSVEIRWVPPGTMVTMEYKFGRLTVGYDAEMKITSIACS